ARACGGITPGFGFPEALATWLVGPMTRPAARSIAQRIHFTGVLADLRCDVVFIFLLLSFVFLWFVCAFIEYCPKFGSRLRGKLGGFGVFTEGNEGNEGLLPKPFKFFTGGNEGTGIPRDDRFFYRRERRQGRSRPNSNFISLPEFLQKEMKAGPVP